MESIAFIFLLFFGFHTLASHTARLENRKNI
nr:MAG TPA: hypothetical protein [Caudoviricetes sp.]